MLQKTKMYIQGILFILCFLIFIGCGPTPKDQSDYTKVSLDKTIDSIKSGLPFAKQRVAEWRKTMHLNYISAGFVGKNQIKNRKGTISYSFYEDSVTKKLDADARVDIDMINSSIVRFISMYGTGKELGGGPEILNTANWEIDIDEAFDIAIEELGEDSIFQYNNPKVALRCCESFWEFAVYSKPEAPYQKFLVKINPENGDVIEVKSYEETE